MKNSWMKHACLCGGLLVLVSCGKEDDLVADYEDPTYMFMPAPGANDETSVLRREFYEKRGSYLLFNDTLRHDFQGYDPAGNPIYFTEKLSLGYTIGDQTVLTTYTYEYLADIEEQRQAVSYLEENILCHLSKELSPFSYFFAKRITMKDNSNNITNAYCATGQRAIAISCYLIPSLTTEAKRRNFNTQVLQFIITRLVANKQGSFSDFYAVSSADYGRTFTAETDAENTRILREKGFLTKGVNSFGTAVNGCCPSTSLDVREFARQIVSYTEEQLNQRYAEYPLILEKFVILRRLLTNMGYVF